MTTQEKLTMAHALEDLGVDIIEAGFAMASEGDFAAIATITQAVRKPRIASQMFRAPRTMMRGNVALAMPAYDYQPDPEPQMIENIIPIGQRCSLVELTDEKCHWPIGDPGQADFFFCGGKTNAGTPYCGFGGVIRSGSRPCRVSSHACFDLGRRGQPPPILHSTVTPSSQTVRRTNSRRRVPCGSDRWHGRG